MKILNCFLTGALLLMCSAPLAHAQLGTPHYKFQNRAELKQLLLKNRRDSHALYDLTILANRRGWLGTVLRTGDEMLEQNRSDPYAQALVAFGVNTGLYARFWDWPVDKTAVNVWNRQSKTSSLQSQSLESQDTGIQLMAAIAKANAPNAREFEESLTLFRKVLKKQPEWADAYFWYAAATMRTAANKSNKDYEAAAGPTIPYYDKAAKLDPGLRYFILSDKSSVLEASGRPREALAAFDGYLRAYPAYEAYWEGERPNWVAKKRERLLKQINQQ